MSPAGDRAALVERIAGTRVLCVGDVMLDRFVYGTVERISPEAPVPVLRIERDSAMLGGAGNVVRNMLALGAEVCFVSLIGRDPAGRELTRLLAAETAVESHLLTAADRRTTIKIRYLAGGQQLLRADDESLAPLDPEQETALVERAKADLPYCSVLVLSDYGKGVLSEQVLGPLLAAARSAGRAVVIDPKGRDYERYRGADLITPNRRELAQATGMATDSDEDIAAAGRELARRHGIGAVLVTRSGQGMTLIGGDGGGAVGEGTILHVPALAREVFDVSGAGDTVAGVIAAALGAGIALGDAVHLANVAAGIVVGKLGTAVAHAGEVQHALRGGELTTGEAKTLSRARLGERLEEWRRGERRIGFTNGCFDILHPGHVSLLDQARAACDVLIVGLNDDASVTRLKGVGRPVQSAAARAAVLGSLAAVDAVVIFAEDTPAALIEAVRPDVLVKGADYRLEEVVGGGFVQSYGGQVLLAAIQPGFSTTAAIARATSSRPAPPGPQSNAS